MLERHSSLQGHAADSRRVIGSLARSSLTVAGVLACAAVSAADYTGSVIANGASRPEAKRSLATGRAAHSKHQSCRVVSYFRRFTQSLRAPSSRVPTRAPTFAESTISCAQLRQNTTVEIRCRRGVVFDGPRRSHQCMFFGRQCVDRKPALLRSHSSCVPRCGQARLERVEGVIAI